MTRAINDNEIREIDGEQTLGELQLKLTQSQDKMMAQMSALNAAAGELSAAGSSDIPRI